jgi:hypothetical protein
MPARFTASRRLVIHCRRVTHPNVVHFDVSVTLTLVCAWPHISPLSRCARGKPVPQPLSTRRRPEEAQTFAARRPADEGSLHSHPANKIQFLSSPAKRGICSPQHRKTGCPTSRALRDVAVGKWEDAANQSSCTRNHDPFVYGGHSCPPPSRPKPTTAPAPHRTFVTALGFASSP